MRFKFKILLKIFTEVELVFIDVQGINLLFWQQGETIFLQVSISSMQTFPYIQSPVWTHGPNSAAHGPFSHGPNP